MSKRSESQEQIDFFQWAEWLSAIKPELKLLFHVPNGGLRSPAVAKKLKAEGVKAGVPDIFLPVARGGYHGLFIEMKTEKGRPTIVQKKWLADLSENGYCTRVCHGFEHAKDAVTQYLMLGEYGDGIALTDDEEAGV